MFNFLQTYEFLNLLSAMQSTPAYKNSQLQLQNLLQWVFAILSSTTEPFYSPVLLRMSYTSVPPFFDKIIFSHCHINIFHWLR